MKDACYAMVIRGTGYHAPAWGEIEVLKDHLFCIGNDGNIAAVVAPGDSDFTEVQSLYAGRPNYYELHEGQYILPGFVDLHVHAPQWVNAGKAMHVPLEVWLQEVTFPMESNMARLEMADRIYRDVVETTMRHGTTTAVYFGTQDKEATLWLGSICARLGQRGYIGKVAMDNPDECPDYYRDADSKAAIAATEDFIIRLMKRGESTIQGLVPVITPRFAPSCTDEAMAGLGELVKRYDVPVQTHCAESNWEAGYAWSRFGKSDAQVLADFGFMTPKTILAHGTQLTDADVELLVASGASVAHCPISNVFFSNSVLAARKRHEQGLNIGLGTDISGGYSPSMYANIRMAVIASRMLEEGVNSELPAAERGVPNSRIDYRHAFYMATTGGGVALKRKIGLLREGYAFDVQVVDVNTDRSDIRLYPDFDSDEDILQKILFMSNSGNIISLWVQGQEVFRLMRRYHV